PRPALVRSHSSFFLSRVLVVFFSTIPSCTALYPLSLHDALPIYSRMVVDRSYITLMLIPAGTSRRKVGSSFLTASTTSIVLVPGDRKSTRLNSSHQIISYAVFCLKKKTGYTLRQCDSRD